MSILGLSLILALGVYLVCNKQFESTSSKLTNRLIGIQVRAPIFLTEMAQVKALCQKFFRSKSLQSRALAELPEILEILSVALSAGLSLVAALAKVTPRAKGILARELQHLFIAIELGGDFDSELQALGKRLPHRQVIEFVSKLRISLKRGSPIAQLLRELSGSARAEIRNELLRQVGRNETRMLIPLVFLILPVTVLFAIYPSLQLLNLDYQ